MGQYAITNHWIFQTEGDIHNGQGAGLGIVRTEQVSQALSKALTAKGNQLLIGFGLPSSGSLTNSVTGGTAVIDGYVIQGTGSNTVSFEASSTVHVVLKLTYSNGKVVGAIFETFAQTGIPVIPQSSLYLGYVVTGASTITSSHSATSEAFHAWGAIEVEGTTRHLIRGGSSNWYTDAAAAPVTIFPIKFPVALAKAPRFISAWMYPAASWPGSAASPEPLKAVGTSTTEVQLTRVTGSFADGDFINFEIRE